MKLARGAMRSASLVVVALAAAAACQLVLASPGDDEATDSLASDFDGILKSEQIFIRNEEDGTTFNVLVEPNEKVDVLQRKVYEIAGIPPSRQRLSIGKVCLHEDYELYVYKINGGSVVNLSTWPRDGQQLTSFEVISPTRERFPISTRLSDSVASLKETLTQWTNISSKRQRLIVRGKELEDKRQLLDYDIWNGTSVFMGAPVDAHRGEEATVYVKTLSGATIPVGIELSVTVDKLKEKIRELTGAPKFVQLLMFYGMTLNEPDFLCDYGLVNGSRVYLTFISQQVKDFSLVERLQVVIPEAPIFRVASEENQAGVPRRSVYIDRRNWMYYQLRRQPRMIFHYLSPIAYLEPSPDDEGAMERARVLLKSVSPDDRRWSNRALRAQHQIATILRPYRTGAVETRGERPSIELGAIWQPDQPLGANLNNFAPNELADEEIMYLFDFRDKIRQQLESDAQTGEGTLGLPMQKTLNNKLLRVYLEALAGLPLATERYQPPEGEDCAMCRDSLRVEPSFKPPCGHGFHIDCALGWLSELLNQDESGMCPYCRAPFRFSYATYAEDELDRANEKD